MKHAWSEDRVIQRCTNRGCTWLRQKKPDAGRHGGPATTAKVYSTDGQQWATMEPVPKCEGTA